MRKTSFVTDSMWAIAVSRIRLFPFMPTTIVMRISGTTTEMAQMIVIFLATDIRGFKALPPFDNVLPAKCRLRGISTHGIFHLSPHSFSNPYSKSPMICRYLTERIG